MSEDNKNNLPQEPEKNTADSESIDEILKSFQRDRKSRESNPDFISMPEAPIKSERQKIDFSAPIEEQAEEKPEAKKRKAIKIDFKKLIKPVIIIIAAIAVIVGAIFGIRYAAEQAKVSYLKPYQQKYPDVAFPEGILEKYCDIYAKNPTAKGYITIGDIKLDSVVMPKESEAFPVAEENMLGARQNNYVVYLDNSSLEEYYKDADSYNNKASGFMQYSDFFNDYSFKIIGAFYTNTKAEDDAGYIFPYNVTEEMTNKSAAAFADRLQTRFLYDTGITITREDKFLTISCPTDYRKNFRFVVVGVMRDDTEKLTAGDKSMIRYPQVIYDEQNMKNPYRFASQWYPEIVVANGKDTTKIHKQKIDDYKQEKSE